MSLLISPFVVGLTAFYLLALPGPFLVRLVLCVGLVVGCLAWRRSDRTAAAPGGAGWADEAVWPGRDVREPEAPAAQGGARWTVTRRPDRWEGGPAASTQEAPALPGRAGELQLVAVLVNQTGQQAELHLAPGMANLPVAVLARQAAGLMSAEQGDTGWRLEWLEVVDPARAGQPGGPGARMPWGWGG